jgi:D-psicose/D-tagatose/L-ribulose 3-epimerase
MATGIRYGMNLLLWTAHVTAEHFPILADLKKTGFDGVEIPLFDGDAAHYKSIRQELDKQGLASTAVCCVDKTCNPVSPDAGIRAKGLERIKWAIEMTAILGGTHLAGPYHSALGEFTGQPPTASEKKWAVEILRAAAEFAAQHKVTLSIEYLNRFECYFLTTAADAKELVQEVNHPSFRSMYDTFHANIEEKRPGTVIEGFADVMSHVHISENDRGIPGTGMVHWDETFAALKKVGYKGWLTIESFGRALPDLAAATKVWRDLFPSPRDVYQDGLRFMKSKMG